MDRFSFGDSPEMADKLLEHVLSGRKTATTTAYTDKLPENHVGKKWIVLDGKGKERAIIETTELKRCRFDEVDEAFAREEGEGDLSLGYWRKVHKDFFMREGTYSPTMEVVCERFKLIKPCIIAVSGFGGSGKSSYAKKLGENMSTPVVGVDSFQMKGAFNTDFSLWQIMDFARLEKEVLKPFFDKKPVIRYGHFNGRTESITEVLEIKNSGLLIVEGVGLFRPELLKYFDYKIWIDVPLQEAIARGKKRDREEYGSPTDELWDGIWKKNDEEYYDSYKPRDKADLIVGNSNSSPISLKP